MTTPNLKSKLDEVNEQISSKTKEAQEKWQAFEQARDEFAGAGNDVNRTESDEFKKAEDIHKEYATVADELKDLEGVQQGIFRMVAGTEPTKPLEAPAAKAETSTETKSIGERAVESDEYKQLQASGVLNSEHAGFNARLGEIPLPELKALIVGTSSPFITPQREPYVPQPRRLRKILDLITVGQTGVDSVEYARQTAFTNVAAETAESTATTTGTKPEATIAFERVSASVKTIAHWIPATRRSLADVPQLQTLIDSQLRYGLEYRLENQVVNGDGSGENLTGILNTANILSQARSSDSNQDAVHKAITQIRLAFVEPTGVAIHPTNWETIRLLKSVAGDGSYFYGPPAIAGVEQLWGLPVAVTPAVPANTGLVGDFRQATLWLRQAAQVLASDSHSDFFVKNLIAVLAEMRAAFGVLLPAGFCKVTSMN